jgi:alanyl aminopeptidase
MSQHLIRGRPHRLRTALAAGSLLCASLALAAPPGPLRLDPAVAPVSERVALEIDPDRPGYRGSVEIELRVAEPTSEFRFDAQGLRLDRARLEGPGGSVALAVSEKDEGLVVARAERTLDPGRYALSISFSGTLGTRAVGLYRVAAGGEHYAFTQFEAADARRAFPCWDEPEYKIPFRIELSIPRGMDAVGNTPVEKSEDRGRWKRVVFARTKPLPSYLLAIAVGRFDFVPIRGMSVPGRIVAPRGMGRLAGTAAREAGPILEAEERYFGIPYPYAKLDLVAVPEFWAGAMENAGAITFKDGILLLDPARVSVRERRELVFVVAHEMAHMWFGDLVTMRWWDDLWLNESFADWLADKITDRIDPRFGWRLASLEPVQRIMETDARPGTVPIRQKVESAGQGLNEVGLAYDKGRAVLAMVERWLGPDVFRRGVRRYLEAHRFGSATGEDLWDALSKASGRDVESPMHSFLDQPGLPLVSVVPEAGAAARLTQKRFLNAGARAVPETWSVPVVLKFSSGSSVGERSLLLDSASARVELPAAPDWILPNADSAGYYRWSIPQAMLESLARKGPAAMNPSERIGFIGNLRGLVEAGEIPAGKALELLSGFGADPEPAVASMLVRALDGLRMPLATPDLAPAWAAYVRRVFRPALDRIGMEPRPGEPPAATLLRPSLLEELGEKGGDAEVAAFGRKEAAEYLKAPSAVDPSLALACLRIAAADGDMALFEQYRRKFESAAAPAERRRFLEALSAFRRPDVQAAMLSYAASGPLRSTELLVIPRWMDDDAGQRRARFRWLVDNFSTISSRIPPEFVGMLPHLAGGCEMATWNEARAFFAKPEHRAGATSGELERTGEQVEECARLRKREGGSAARFLER